MDRHYLLARSLFTIAALHACGGREASPPRVRMVRGANHRAALVGRPADQFAAARSALIDAGAKGALSVDLHDGAHSTVVELPATPALDDVTSVVVVRIDSVGRYGTTKVPDTAALEVAARRDAGTASVILLRVADDVPLGQLIAVAEALTRAGIGHVILGLVPAGVVPPSDGWASCPFPTASDADSGAAMLSIEWDEQGRPGTVRVLESSGHGFGGAA